MTSCKILSIRAAIGIGIAYVLLLWMTPIASAAEPDDTSGEIRNLLTQASAPDFDFHTLDISTLRAFYERRAYRPSWTGTTIAEKQNREIRAALLGADQDGLEPAQYHVEMSILRHPPNTPLAAAEADIVLTDGALRFARDLRTGRAALKSIDRDIDLADQAFDAAGALDSALQGDKLTAFLSDLAPPTSDYNGLKQALKRYRALAAEGGWPLLPQAPATAYDEGGADADLLRRRLAYEDDAVAAEAGGSLSDAVKRFQARHGLDTDGRVGRQTLEALNIPAAERAMEIAANMERWRWLPRAFEPSYVVVNVPDATLKVVEGDRIVLTSRVIVGRPRDPTPILRAVAIAVTANPPWNVPSPIARKEILPKLRRNRSYLAAQNMILRDGPAGDPYGQHINWHAIGSGHFPYSLQQRPGPKNALGAAKLELPNRFSVYLHDTPAKALFDRNERFLSHGCIRVQQILPLASYALTGDPLQQSGLMAAIEAGATQTIPLSRPLPIYVLYWTVFPDPDGSVEFRPDIYLRDQRLIAIMNSSSYGERVTSNISECRAG